MCWNKKGNSNVVMNHTCRKCEGNIGEAVEQEVKICDEVVNASEFTYLADRVCSRWTIRGCCDCQNKMLGR